jgi:SH3 domain-containing YSC84-like protein 1
MGLFGSASLTKECDRAASILKSFVDKKKIPASVIANAKGIAIFTGFRAAMWISGTSGSGIVLARLPDGSWSPPSAFGVVSGSAGLVLGVDSFDCVCILNTQEAVDAYMRSESTVGAGATLAAGPIGGTADLSSKDIPSVWTYTKSKGLYGGLTVDGTILREKSDLNADAYGTKVSASNILTGKVDWPSTKQLPAVLNLAEGKSADAKVLGGVSDDPTAGDSTQ